MTLTRAWTLAMAASAGGVTPATAQSGMWDAVLAINPVPSPYVSDWDANPDFGTLTVFNGAGQDQSVRLVFNVVDGTGRLLASGSSEPQLIPGASPTIFDSPFDIAGSTRHDADIESQMRRTGRLPEGDYRACVAVVDLGGFQLAEACESFAIVYPDPPLLVAPFDDEEVTSQDIFFQWTPSQTPLAFGLRYILQIAEIRAGQLPAEALRSSVLHFFDPDVGTTQLQYPLSAQPFEAGARYAWQVQALDVNGYPVAANEGSSEIWTFTFDDGTGAGTPTTRGEGAPSTFRLQLQETEPAEETEDTKGAFVESAMSALCASGEAWAAGTADSALTVNVSAPFFKSDTLDVHVYWDTDGQSQEWGIHGRSQRRNWEYFARGDCDGPTDDLGLVGSLARLHWIAARPVEYRFSDYLAEAFSWNRPDSGAADSTNGPSAHEGIELEFGTGILSFRSTTVGETEPFPAEHDFFEGHEIDVLPGLNAYGVVWMPEGSLWSRIKDWGFRENKFELQGFVGMANTVSAGVELEKTDGGEVDVSLQQKFLVLTLLFPKRTPQHFDWIRSMRGGIQISVEDSLTTGVGPGSESKVGVDVFVKLLWIWDVNDDVTITWVGGLDFNAGVERESGGSWEAGAKIDLILSGECECVWESPFGVGNWWIGNPKLEMHYTLVGDTGLSLAGTFQTGWGDAPPFVLGGSLTWEPQLTVDPRYQRLKDSADAALATYTDARNRFQSLPPLTISEEEQQRRQLDDTMEPDQRAYVRARRAMDRAEQAHREAQDALDAAMRADPQAFTRKKIDWRHPEWRVRVAAGNVGFMELIEFVKSLW